MLVGFIIGVSIFFITYIKILKDDKPLYDESDLHGGGF